jgi:hypothetical protein
MAGDARREAADKNSYWWPLGKLKSKPKTLNPKPVLCAARRSFFYDVFLDAFWEVLKKPLFCCFSHASG